MGAASAPLCRASLRYGERESKWASEKEPQEGIGKSAGEWHFTLRER